MTQPPKEKQDAPRRGRPQPIGQEAGTAGDAAFNRAGFSDPLLVLHWREIAGPETARIAQPIRMTESASGGVLTLLAEPGAALFLGHESRALCERINAYLGRPAIARVKFVQGALTVPPAPPAPPRPAKAARQDDPARQYQGPDGLKAALESLARWRGREK